MRGFALSPLSPCGRMRVCRSVPPSTHPLAVPHPLSPSPPSLLFTPPFQNYYDNRYWTMWKLPMFGCTDPSQVLKEIAACVKAAPDAYVRMAAFDASRQVQVTSMLVHRPAAAKDWQPPNKRQIA